MRLTSINPEKWQIMLEAHNEWAKETNLGQAPSNDPRHIRLTYQHIMGERKQVSNLELHSIELIGCLVENVMFINCDFDGSYFIASVFVGCTFQKCNFRKAELEYGSYVGIDFNASSFLKASFRGSSLLHANFRETDLTGTDFDKVDLRFANLQDTTLLHTRFSESHLFSNQRFQPKLLENVYMRDVTYHFTGGGENYSDEEAIGKIFYVLS